MRFTSISTVAISTLVGAGALILVAGPNQPSMRSPRAASAQTSGPTASSILRTAGGDEVGRVSFTQIDTGVAVEVTATALPAGFHGFHVHTAGQCVGPDFTSAGGHFDPGGMSSAPMHAGDLPSLLVKQDGTAELRTVTDRFKVTDLVSGSGTSVIVHANADNFGNIPSRYTPAPDATTMATGDAGPRIACGVIQPAATDSSN
jgi:Cu-Zn family superoxide dismutase